MPRPATSMCPAWSSAIGSDVPARTAPERFRQKFNLQPSVRDLRRADRREQGLRRAVQIFPAVRRNVPARPRPGARRQRDHAGAAASAHSPSRLPQRRRQVRRDGRRRRADHAVVLREPLDGRARGVGARPPGARERPLRRPERPVHPQRRWACTTNATRSSPRRCSPSNRTVRCIRASAATDGSTSSSTIPGR